MFSIWCISPFTRPGVFGTYIKHTNWVHTRIYKYVLWSVRLYDQSTQCMLNPFVSTRAATMSHSIQRQNRFSIYTYRGCRMYMWMDVRACGSILWSAAARMLRCHRQTQRALVKCCLYVCVRVSIDCVTWEFDCFVVTWLCSEFACHIYAWLQMELAKKSAICDRGWSMNRTHFVLCLVEE